MNFRKQIIKIISVILISAMVFSMASCGTIMYPERRHRDLQVSPGGRPMDSAVVVLDAVCLLFFIIPGIVAFSVDYSTGAIYLPGGKGKGDKS